MAKYGSIDEFRAALNGLVGQTGGTRSSRQNPTRSRPSSRRKSRARRNSPVRLLADGTLEADTPEEMAAIMSQAPARRPSSRKRKPRMAMPGGQKPREPFDGQLRDPSGPPSYGQGKAIGFSIGGMAAYCPQYEGVKMSHKDALAEMGLTKAAASAVIDALKAQGVFMKSNNPAAQAQARQILAEVGGVVCSPKQSLGRRRALNNPYFY